MCWYLRCRSTHTESDLQTIVNRFTEASRLFGLTISLNKTKVLRQPAPGTRAPPPKVYIELKTVDQFRYLGSIISSDGTIDKEIAARISKASQALGRLRTRVLNNNNNVKLSTKIKVYKAVVLPSLLYGCESWTLYRKHLKQLERFHMRSLRSLIGIKWQDKVTNLEVRDNAGLVSVEALILKTEPCWQVTSYTWMILACHANSCMAHSQKATGSKDGQRNASKTA